jgi:zinc/manganese transport system ATP-binding protein
VRDAPPAVRLRDASVAYGGRSVWSHGDLEIPAGGLVCVIGPNGSGKTSLVRLLLGTVPPATGSVEVLGAPARRGNPRIGYVPQRFGDSIGEAVTGRDLVRLGHTGNRWGLRRAPGVDDEVTAALEAVDALGFASSRLATLSGGQQQRIAVAQALVGHPDLLILDEPLANLDLRNQRDVVDMLAEVRRTRDVTVLVVVHDLNPFLPHVTGIVYLLDGHPHYGAVSDVVDGELLTHLYGTSVQVVRTATGDLYTRARS